MPYEHINDQGKVKKTRLFRTDIPQHSKSKTPPYFWNWQPLGKATFGGVATFRIDQQPQFFDVTFGESLLSGGLYFQNFKVVTMWTNVENTTIILY